jgi:hypothetical protein
VGPVLASTAESHLAVPNRTHLPAGSDNGGDSDRGAAMVYDWLVNLPELWQVPLATGTVGLFSLAVTAIFRRVTATRRRESHNDVLGLVFGACSIMYAVLIGFVIADVFGEYQHADRVTTDEAATLVTLYLDTERYPDPPRRAMQQAIRQYTRSVADDEFPTAIGPGPFQRSLEVYAMVDEASRQPPPQAASPGAATPRPVAGARAQAGGHGWPYRARVTEFRMRNS